MPVPLLFLMSSQQCSTIFLKISASELRHCKPSSLLLPFLSQSPLMALYLWHPQASGLTLFSPWFPSLTFMSWCYFVCSVAPRINLGPCAHHPACKGIFHPVTQVNHLYLQTLPRPLISVSTMSTLILVSISLSGAITRLWTCLLAVSHSHPQLHLCVSTAVASV